MKRIAKKLLGGAGTLNSLKAWLEKLDLFLMDRSSLYLQKYFIIILSKDFILIVEFILKSHLGYIFKIWKLIITIDLEN